jgi:hypothetical protein
VEDNCVSFRYDIDFSVLFSTLGMRNAMLEAADQDDELKIRSISVARFLQHFSLIKYLPLENL